MRVYVQREIDPQSAAARKGEHLLHQTGGSFHGFLFAPQCGARAPDGALKYLLPPVNPSHIIDVLRAPVAAPHAAGEEPGRLSLAVVSEREHGVVAIGVHHDGVESHLGGLARPVFPVGEIPTRAPAQKIVPVEQDSLPHQGSVDELPGVKSAGAELRIRLSIVGQVKPVTELLEQGVNGK